MEWNESLNGIMEWNGMESIEWNRMESNGLNGME